MMVLSILAAIVVVFLIVGLILWVLDKTYGKRVRDSLNNNTEEPRKFYIGEPVVSFIETYEANPKRFKVWVSHVQGELHRGPHCNLLDKFNSNQFSLHTKSRGLCGVQLQKTPSTAFLTEDEVQVIWDFISQHYEVRRIKIRQRKRERAEKLSAALRDKYIKDYCKGDV